MTLRIFIADDSDPVRKAIKTLLLSDSNEWLVCGEAADGNQVIMGAVEAMPDVILLDLSLPQVSGAVLATKLRDTIPSATIVIMSAQDPGVIRRIADSFRLEYCVPKSSLGTDLIASLESIARNKRIPA
jgi:DNA-binding NarL/FixJ family response regulator